MGLRHLLLTLTLATGGACADVCYTLYDRDGNIIYGGQTPPFDMSTYSLEHERSRERGEHLVVNQVSACHSFEGRPEVLEAMALDRESNKVFLAPSESILPESLRNRGPAESGGGDGFLGVMSSGSSSAAQAPAPTGDAAAAAAAAPRAPGARSGSVPSSNR